MEDYVQYSWIQFQTDIVTLNASKLGQRVELVMQKEKCVNVLEQVPRHTIVLFNQVVGVIVRVFNWRIWGNKQALKLKLKRIRCSIPKSICWLWELNAVRLKENKTESEKRA